MVATASYQHLVSLKEEEIFELSLGQLVPLVQLALLHFPDGSFPSPHALLLLLQELSVEQRDLLAMRVVESTQRRLQGVVQLRQK